MPAGWTYKTGAKNITSFRNAKGKFIKNRKAALNEMFHGSGYSKAEIYHIRDGLLDEGWKYHQDIPPGWLYKQYRHKIEGIDTEILYHLSPDGIVFRSKKKITISN